MRIHQEKHIVATRKKLWDMFGFGYRDEENRLRKRHSLNCGCSFCRSNTWFRKYENRQKRREYKDIIKYELEL